MPRLQILRDIETFSETSKIPHCWLNQMSHREKKSSQNCKAHGRNATALAVTFGMSLDRCRNYWSSVFSAAVSFYHACGEGTIWDFYLFFRLF